MIFFDENMNEMDSRGEDNGWLNDGKCWSFNSDDIKPITYEILCTKEQAFWIYLN